MYICTCSTLCTYVHVIHYVHIYMDTYWHMLHVQVCYVLTYANCAFFSVIRNIFLWNSLKLNIKPLISLNPFILQLLYTQHVGMYCTCIYIPIVLSIPLRLLKIRCDKTKFISSASVNKSMFQSIHEEMNKCIPESLSEATGWIPIITICNWIPKWGQWEDPYNYDM